MPNALEMITKAYLLGALHDGTSRKTTYRIAQKNKQYIQLLANAIKQLGYSAWTYKEGKNRNLYIVEFSKFVLKDAQINRDQDKIVI